MRLDDFKEYNASKGYHFFKPNTMRFFKSRVSNYDVVTGLFITSEKGPCDSPRLFTVRKADFETGNVSTIGEFQAYRSLGAAKTAIKAIRRA